MWQIIILVVILFSVVFKIIRKMDNLWNENDKILDEYSKHKEDR